MADKAEAKAGDLKLEAHAKAWLQVVGEQAEAELDRQFEKWGAQWRSPATWWLIVGEEVGELAKTVLEGRDKKDVAAEAAQVFACVARLMAAVSLRLRDQAAGPEYKEVMAAAEVIRPRLKPEFDDVYKSESLALMALNAAREATVK